jgi:dipeptidyl aminopeptidase/acylaminoacyl peptidase
MNLARLSKYVQCCTLLLLWVLGVVAQSKDTAERKKVMVTSSIDRTAQPSYLYLPANINDNKKRPLVVLLHTWSNDLEQRFEPLEREVARRGWILLEPNFRGRNDHPEACASPLAQQDILDAVSWVKQHYSINHGRVYLVGFSGGGYLTMLMAAKYPKQWAAASAWCGISDLTQWYDYHANDHYGEMMRQCFGGPPQQSDSIGLQYSLRSPVTHLSKRTKVPLDIAAGRNDSIVPPRHSLNAFNVLVKSGGGKEISNDEVNRVLASSQSSNATHIVDPVLGRHIYLRQQAGRYRITIYEGKHDWVPEAAMQWFDSH